MLVQHICLTNIASINVICYQALRKGRLRKGREGKGILFVLNFFLLFSVSLHSSLPLLSPPFSLLSYSFLLSSFKIIIELHGVEQGYTWCSGVSN